MNHLWGSDAEAQPFVTIHQISLHGNVFMLRNLHKTDGWYCGGIYSEQITNLDLAYRYTVICRKSFVRSDFVFHCFHNKRKTTTSSEREDVSNGRRTHGTREG